MTPFTSRVALFFALAALTPVALTGLVWLGVTSTGRNSGSQRRAIVEKRIEEYESRRVAAVMRLCRDDLAVDALLEQRATEASPELDYERLFRGAMEAAGLDALWVIDAHDGEVIATGHRALPAGQNGAELNRLVLEAPDETFALLFGAQDHQRFLAHACSIARGGARLNIVGAHRVSTLRAIDADRIAVVGAAAASNDVLVTLTDSAGIVQGSLVWRSGTSSGAPPLLLWLGCVALLSIGLALLLGGRLNSWLQSSVDDLTEAATRVGRGDFDTTLRDDSGGAFPATATAFNRMTHDLRDARAQLRRTERVAAWQEIAKSLAHELKNPLSPIRLSIENLRKAHARAHDDFDTMFDESTRTILQEVDRLRNIVDEFSRFARLPSPTLRRTDVRDVVSHACSLHTDGEVPVELTQPSRPVEALVDSDQLTQVLHNLLQNARDAAESAHPEGGGKVCVELDVIRDSVRIRVEDNGRGIPPAETDAVFEPYHTGKDGGTGLGLAIAQRIVSEHGGRIDLESRPGKTVFTVLLTVSAAGARSAT